MGQIQPKRSGFFRRWGLALAAAVTALTVWLSARKLDIGALRKAFGQADYFLIGAAAVISVLAILIVSLRWRLLLRPGGIVNLGKVFRITVVSQYINIVTPGRFGEPAKAILVARGAPFPPAFALGTVAVEKALDFFIFLALWTLALALFPLRGAVREYTVAVILGGFLAAALVVFAWKPKPVLRAVRWAMHFLPAKFRRGGGDFAEKGVEAFQVLRDLRTVPALAALTLLVLAGEILPNWLLLRAFGLDVPFWAALFVLIVLQVGKLPPSLPGKIGVYQYAVILALAPFGVGRDEALGYSIMLHAVTFIPRIVLGMVFAAGLGAAAWRTQTGAEKTVNAPGGAEERGDEK